MDCLDQINGPWRWFFLRETPPKVTFEKKLLLRIMDRCEALYESRPLLIQPYVASDELALDVNAALIWNGFVPANSNVWGNRAKILPVFIQACYVVKPSATDEELREVLNRLWDKAFGCWLPIVPASS